MTTEWSLQPITKIHFKFTVFGKDMWKERPSTNNVLFQLKCCTLILTVHGISYGTRLILYILKHVVMKLINNFTSL